MSWATMCVPGIERGSSERAEPLASFFTVPFHSDAWESAWSNEKGSWVGVRSPSDVNQSSPLVCFHCLAYAIRFVLFALTITEHSEGRERLSSTVLWD